MEGMLNVHDPDLLNHQHFLNAVNISNYGFLVTRKKQLQPFFIPGKFMSDSILSRVKKCGMKLEFVFLSEKMSPSNLRKKYKAESRWLVQEVLTYRSRVWEILMVDCHDGDTEFLLDIDYGYLLCESLKENMALEINDPQSSVSRFGSNMRQHVQNYGTRWFFY